MSVQHRDVEFEVAGVNGLLMRFTNQLDERLPSFLSAFREYLLSTYGGVIEQVVPAYTTMMIAYDPRQCRMYDLQQLLVRALQEINTKAQLMPPRESAIVKVPAIYGGQYGPDLELVAAQAQLTPEQVIKLHSETIYHVYALGFAPGFSYLGSLPEAIRLPRRSTPRQQIPAGSVAIAEQQTAVYPNDSPGGWHIIGFSPLQWFDCRQNPMTPLQVGDQVQFVVMQPEELATWQESHA